MANDDMALLREYAAGGSEAAFGTLVGRYVNLVYSSALRQVRDADVAEEVTQAVFIILARKADRLGPETVLPSWLHRTACYASADALKSRMRRARREQEAYMQSLLREGAPDEAWRQIEPLLDTAIAGLGEQDRQAIVLRFFENKNFGEMGQQMGAGEDAARMRVKRALERLRKFFTKRGVALSAAALGTAMAANSVQAAPPALAKTVTTVALAKGTTASSSALALTKGVLKFMAWTKAKMAIGVGVGLVLVAGTSTVAIQKVEAYHAERDAWRGPRLDSGMIDQVPEQVRFLPTKFGPGQSRMSATVDGERWAGIAMPLRGIIQGAYGWSQGRMVFVGGEDKRRFDFISNLKEGAMPALQREVEQGAGIRVHREMRETDVLKLRVVKPDAPGLKPPNQGGANDWSSNGHYVCDDRPIDSSQQPFTGLVRFLEGAFDKPVVDETGLTEHYSIDLKWGPNTPAALKKAMREQLGLELVPERDTVEMLVVEKSK